MPILSKSAQRTMPMTFHSWMIIFPLARYICASVQASNGRFISLVVVGWGRVKEITPSGGKGKFKSRSGVFGRSKGAKKLESPKKDGKAESDRSEWNFQWELKKTTQLSLRGEGPKVLLIETVCV